MLKFYTEVAAAAEVVAGSYWASSDNPGFRLSSEGSHPLCSQNPACLVFPEFSGCAVRCDTSWHLESFVVEVMLCASDFAGAVLAIQGGVAGSLNCGYSFHSGSAEKCP